MDSTWTELHHAAWGDDQDTGQTLIASSAGIRDRTSQGFSASFLAVANDSSRMTRLLIKELGDEIIMKDGVMTPLHLAAGLGCAETVRVLLELGAPLFASHAVIESSGSRNEDTWISATAKFHERGHYPIQYALSDYWTSSKRGKFLQKPPMGAGSENSGITWRKSSIVERVAVVQQLVKFRPDSGDIDAADEQGRTLLHWAAHGTNLLTDVQAVKFAIDHGANVNAIDSDGNTPAHINAGQDSSIQLELLESNGASKAIKNNAGQNYLEYGIDPSLLELHPSIIESRRSPSAYRKNWLRRFNRELK